MIRIILLCSLIFFGCNNDKSSGIDSYRVPKSTEMSVKSELGLIQSTELFSWNVPDNWIQANTTPFSQANYLIPSPEGSADITVSYFEGNAGGIEANINRWRMQLGLQELSKEQIDLIGETFSSKIGQYTIYKIINPDNNKSGFLCSIIPTKNHTIFIKLKTYPETIDYLKEQFIKFSSSFDYNE